MTDGPPAEVTDRWAGRCWPCLFWALLLAGGVSLLQVSSGQIRVAAASITASVWTWPGMLAAMIWACVCLTGLVLEVLTPVRAEGWRLGTRARAAAICPVLGVVAIAAAQRLWGFYHFVQLPVTVVLLGWCVGRVAGRRALWPAGGSRAAGRGSPKPATTGWPLLVVGVTAAAFAFFWYVSLERAAASGHLGYPDAGIFASRLVNTVHGTHPFRENGDAAAFWDHFDPGLYLLAPLVVVFDALSVLNAAGAVAAALPALIWFWFARRRGWPTGPAIALAAGWLLLPGVSQALYAMSLGFHPALLAMPLVALSLVLLGRRRWLAFGACAVVASSFRETVALSYAGVGLWLICVPQRRRGGAVILASAVVYFLIVTGLVIPCFRGGAEYLGLERFAHLGDGMVGILLSPVLCPGAFWGAVFSQQSLVYAAVLFGCMGLVPVLNGGRRLLMLLPEGLFLLLWDEPLTRSIAYQYHVVLLVLLYWLSVDSLSSGREGSVGARLPGTRGCLCPGRRTWTMIGSAAAGSFLLGWWPGLRDTTPFDLLPSRQDTMAWIRSAVRDKDTVAATRRAATHCLHAAELHVLPDYAAALDAWPEVFVLDYADDWGRLDLPGYLPRLRQWHRRLMDSDYRLSAAREAVAVYRRGGLSQAQGRPELDQLPSELAGLSAVPLAPTIGLLCWSLDGADRTGDGRQPRCVNVVAYLSIEAVPTTDLGIALALRLRTEPAHNVAHSGVRPAGGMLVPSTEWRAPCIIAERACVPWLLPDPPDRGALELVVELYDLETGLLLTAARSP